MTLQVHVGTTSYRCIGAMLLVLVKLKMAKVGPIRIFRADDDNDNNKTVNDDDNDDLIDLESNIMILKST